MTRGIILQELGYVAKSKRKIAQANAYINSLIGQASNTTIEVKADASVFDTLAHMEKVVKNTLPQTKRLADYLNKQSFSKEMLCKNIFDFCYKYIQYLEDARGFEQIRQPARTWNDRFSGVDCDCYSVFISSILTNLNIPHSFRIIKLNGKENFQHVYVVVMHKNSEIIIDPVLDDFNMEAPGITGKHDHVLNGIPLQELSGLGIIEPVTLSLTITAITTLLKNKEAIAAKWRSFGNKDNTTLVPGGWVEFWKYFPGQPLHGRPITNTDCTVGYFRQYEKDLFADGTARNAGINDYAMMESLFKNYAPKFLNDYTVNKSWATFWKALVDEYAKDLQKIADFEKMNSGSGSSGNNSGSGNGSGSNSGSGASDTKTASMGLYLIGGLSLAAILTAVLKNKPKSVENEKE